MDLWDALKAYAIPSETVRTYLEKIGWEPTPRQLASIFCGRKLPLENQTEFLSHLDPAGDETLAAQIQTLLERPADLVEGPAHFMNDPPVSETVSFPFHVGDIVWCVGAEFDSALYVGLEYGLVILAGENRPNTPWTTFPGQDGVRLGVEFLNEQGNFIPSGISPWALERATPWDEEPMLWRYLKQGSDLLLGRGSFCEFLSAREAFCREFPKIRATRYKEIDAILCETSKRLTSGEEKFTPAEELFAKLEKKLEMAEKNGAKPKEDALDE